MPSRRHCAPTHCAFPRPTRTWDERVIKVRGKIFAFLGMVDNKFRLGVKLTHSNEAALGLPSVEPNGYGLGGAGWVTVWVKKPGQPPVDLLKAWIDESYRTIAPRKLVAQLSSPGDSRAAAKLRR